MCYRISGDQEGWHCSFVYCFSGSNADAANSSSSVRKPELTLLPPHPRASKQMHPRASKPKHPCGVHQLSSVDPPLLTYPAKDSFTESAPRVITKDTTPETGKFLPKTKLRATKLAVGEAAETLASPTQLSSLLTRQGLKAVSTEYLLTQGKATAVSKPGRKLPQGEKRNALKASVLGWGWGYGQGSRVRRISSLY